MQASRWTTLLLVLALLFIAAACGDNGGDIDQEDPTATIEETPNARAENELGEAPIFFRTSDNFATMVAEESYKILLRVTNGYAEERISMVAVRVADGRELNISSNIAEPVGEDLPGSYYPTFILLPEPGAWELTVFAGEDEATITFDVAEAPG